jgi:hypothetical protein
VLLQLINDTDHQHRLSFTSIAVYPKQLAVVALTPSVELKNPAK